MIGPRYVSYANFPKCSLFEMWMSARVRPVALHRQYVSIPRAHTTVNVPTVTSRSKGQRISVKVYKAQVKR